MSPWKHSAWQKIGSTLIDFFHRLGQIQAPDSDIILTYPLRQPPQITHPAIKQQAKK